MAEADLDRLDDFMRLAIKLKGIDRTGWVISEVSNPEHVGDHSFSTALISFLLARRTGLDANKCMLMALIHDLNEVFTGDIATRFNESDQVIDNKSKRKLGEESTAKIFAYLPKEESSYLLEIAKEYLLGESPESKLVHQADTLDSILLLREYSARMKPGMKEEFMLTAGKKIDTKEFRYLYEKVCEEVNAKDERQVK